MSADAAYLNFFGWRTKVFSLFALNLWFRFNVMHPGFILTWKKMLWKFLEVTWNRARSVLEMSILFSLSLGVWIIQNKLDDSKVKQLVYLAQSRDLNPMKSLWDYLKKKTRDINPPNLEEVDAIASEEWSKITVSVQCDLLRSYQKWWKAITANKGYTIDY